MKKNKSNTGILLTLEGCHYGNICHDKKNALRDQMSMRIELDLIKDSQ